MKAGTTIHRRSIEFQQKRLFCDIDHFSELEQRITALRQDDRGPAFEAFAEACVQRTRRFRRNTSGRAATFHRQSERS